MDYDDDNEPLSSSVKEDGEDVPGYSASQNGSQDIEYVSKEGYEKLQAELVGLKTKERLSIAERLEYAKSLGDLSENAEFDAAKEQQMLNEMRISELENILSRAAVIEKNRPSSTVSIGSTIAVRVGASGISERYTIVGSSEEANPMAGFISHESPLGRAFLGHKKGEQVVVSAPRGETKYVIVEIA